MYIRRKWLKTISAGSNDNITTMNGRNQWVNIEQWRDRGTVYPVIIVVPANPIFEQGLGSQWNNHRLKPVIRTRVKVTIV